MVDVTSSSVAVSAHLDQVANNLTITLCEDYLISSGFWDLTVPESTGDCENVVGDSNNPGFTRPLCNSLVVFFCVPEMNCENGLFTIDFSPTIIVGGRFVTTPKAVGCDRRKLGSHLKI